MFEDFTPPTRKQTIVIKRDISNWSKTATLIYGMSKSAEMLPLLYTELRQFNRPYNRLRLYQRFSRLRRVEETRSMVKLVKHVPLEVSLTTHLKNQIMLSLYLAKHTVPLDRLLMFIKAEQYDKNRPYMIRKLYGYYHKLRQLAEMKEQRIEGNYGK